MVGSVSTRPTTLLPHQEDSLCASNSFNVIMNTPLSNAVYGSHRFYVPLRVNFFASQSPPSSDLKNISFTTYNPDDQSSVIGAPFPAGDVGPIKSWVEVVGQYDANFCLNSLQFNGSSSVASNQVVLGSDGGWMVVVDAVGSDTPTSQNSFSQSATASTTQQTFRSPSNRYNASSFYVERTYNETFNDVVHGLNESSLYPGSEQVYFCLGDVMYSYYRIPSNSTWETNPTKVMGSPVVCGVTDAMITVQDKTVLFVKVFFSRNSIFEENAAIA